MEREELAKFLLKHVKMVVIDVEEEREIRGMVAEVKLDGEVILNNCLCPSCHVKNVVSVEEDIEFLIEQLSMSDFLGYLQSVGYAPDDYRLRDPYVRQLEKESLSGIRCAAAKALGRLKGPRAVEALRRSLGDWDENVRIATAEAIAQISEEA